MLEVLLIASLSLHLLAVNVATGGPLVCLWLKRRERKQGDAAAGQLGRYLAWQSVHGAVIGIVLGSLSVGLLWLGDSENFFAAVSAVPRRRLWFGVVELVFFVVCMAVYAAGWQRIGRRPWLHAGIGLLAATDLIYHFPPLFAAIAVLETRPELWGRELAYTEFLKLLVEPETLARLVHFLLASIAVTGALVMYYSLGMRRREAEEDAGRVAAWGGRLALAPTLLQLAAGVYLLMALPQADRARLLGGDWLAASLLAVSLLATLGLLHHLAAVSLGDAGRREVVRSLALMGLTVLLMVGARQFMRREWPVDRSPANENLTWSKHGSRTDSTHGQRHRL